VSNSFDIAVIGGGISGVSVAARLAVDSRVVVLEAEDHLGTHATGRSAALLVESYGTPGMRRLTTLSRSFFEDPPAGFSEAPLSRRRAGIVYASEADVSRLREEFASAMQYAHVEWLNADEALKLCPLMKLGVCAAAFVEPNALDLDANALLQGFARQVRRKGSEILTTAPVKRAERQSQGWLVEAGEHRITCGVIVNASGAWGDEIAALCGVARRGLQPMRRTAATIGVPNELSVLLSTHPFVAPVDNTYYFKPDAGAIMVSLSEEAPSEPCAAYADDIDVATALERFHEATVVPRARPIATWAGLRTFAPDRLPVVGYDEPAFPGFFWYVGQGGIGIQTSPAHSALAAKLILGRALDPVEAEIAASFRADRFMSAAA
jgi:D-arginine dehydrogenase